jgi:hypothetical protein
MGATTLSITTFSMTTLNIKGLYVTLSTTTLCFHAERHFLFNTMLNAIMLSVVAPFKSCKQSRPTKNGLAYFVQRQSCTLLLLHEILLLSCFNALLQR